ncbi:hypothetical protein B0I37DRAFT_149690 [Chaetomium sp. MPI-CAGE-AT-0009]|nr:hypothetical protein B0I37DRAFT_149690 [Chaetomium sp. MPI-CAGE-AT-0009]
MGPRGHGAKSSIYACTLAVVASISEVHLVPVIPFGRGRGSACSAVGWPLARGCKWLHRNGQLGQLGLDDVGALHPTGKEAELQVQIPFTFLLPHSFCWFILLHLFLLVLFA